MTIKNALLIIFLALFGQTVLGQDVSKQNNQNDFFTLVEEMPVYPGGDQALVEWVGQNLKYPKKAKARGITGKVYVSFIVDTDGTVTDVKVIRGVHQLLDAAAVACIEKLDGYSPGKQKGKPVKVQFTIPINFQLK